MGGYRETRKVYWKNGERHVEIVREELSSEETEALVRQMEDHAEQMTKHMESLFGQMDGFFKGVSSTSGKAGRRGMGR